MASLLNLRFNVNFPWCNITTTSPIYSLLAVIYSEFLISLKRYVKFRLRVLENKHWFETCMKTCSILRAEPRHEPMQFSLWLTDCTCLQIKLNKVQSFMTHRGRSYFVTQTRLVSSWDFLSAVGNNFKGCLWMENKILKLSTGSSVKRRNYH